MSQAPTPRRPHESIPPTLADRQALRHAAADYVRRCAPVPPLSLAELDAHTQRLLADAAIDGRYTHYAAVILNNETWRDALAAVPYDRRLLLLPQCLRDAPACAGEMDELGLICGECGRCHIGDIKAQAERLGYIVLIAEGAAVVMSLVQSGKIQGVLGVSCLAALEKIFPYIEAAAVPAVAVPLLYDGCQNTDVDAAWVREALTATAPAARPSPDTEAIHRQVEAWFAPAALGELMPAGDDPTASAALDWLGGPGKRWRPMLAACVYAACASETPGPLPEALRTLAVAVECFHKASLVHDDIEDADEFRYGTPTLHQRCGVPVALNVGDFLLGEGYRLIGRCGLGDAAKVRLLEVAAGGHRELCLGQGRELWWRRHRGPLTAAQMIEIFRQKTSPAFEVGLRFGAACAAAEGELAEPLHRYSDHLGIAYQIHDDLQDFDTAGGDLDASRPSIVLALAWDLADASARPALEALWRGEKRPQARDIVEALGARRAAQTLLTQHVAAAIEALAVLRNPILKAVLRQVLCRVFGRSGVIGASDDLPHMKRPKEPS